MTLGLCAVVAAGCGAGEFAVGLIYGTVAANLAMVGMMRLCARGQMVCRVGWVFAWLGLALGCAWVAGRSVGLGPFGGLALVLVGLIAVWLRLRQHTQNRDKLCETQPSNLRKWWQLALVLLAVIVGVVLLVRFYPVACAVCGVPDGIFAGVLVAPLLVLVAWLGMRRQPAWQAEKLVAAWLWANVGLATVAMGLITLVAGGIAFTQSTVVLTMPWVLGMTVISAVALAIKNKTARWWGGLVVMMYVAYVVSLFW